MLDLGNVNGNSCEFITCLLTASPKCAIVFKSVFKLGKGSTLIILFARIVRVCCSVRYNIIELKINMYVLYMKERYLMMWYVVNVSCDD